MASREQVRAAIDSTVKANMARLAPYAPTMVWTDASAATVSVTVMAKTITANLLVTDTDVEVDAKVPFIFSHFEGRIMQVLSEQLEASFAAARTDASR